MDIINENGCDRRIRMDIRKDKVLDKAEEKRNEQKDPSCM